MTYVKRLLHDIANRIGFDIVRAHRSPQSTLLGLAKSRVGTIIDVGANEGQFARQVLEFFPAAELYCFEPLETPFRILSEWAKTSKGRVHCYQTALGEKEGEVEMHLHTHHSPSSSLLESTDTCHRLYPQTATERLVGIKVSTLDQVLGQALDDMKKDILLKLDVQGYEDRVLRGASQVLSSCGVVVIEVCLESLYEGQADFLQLSNMLYGAGFRYSGNLDQTYDKDGRVVFLDAVFTR